jgi:hypothetical protein
MAFLLNRIATFKRWARSGSPVPMAVPVEADAPTEASF